MRYQQRSALRGSSAVFTLVALLGLTSAIWAQEKGWTTVSAMPTERFGLSTCVVDGVIYAIGGMDDDALRQVEAYDPVTDTWTPRADMPTARQGLSTGVVDGRIYAIGGKLGYSGGAVGAVEEYDPEIDTWTTKSPMPTPRHFLAASVIDGEIYAIGGGSGAGWPFTRRGTVEVYDPETDTWAERSPLPEGVMGLSTGALNGRIHAIGGATVTERGRPDVLEYDPVRDVWTRKADMPTAREWFSACVLDGRVYATGGREYYTAPSGVLSVVEAYDPVTATWAAMPGLATPRMGLSVSAVGGRIFAIGGSTADGSPWTVCSTVEVYDPGSGPDPTSIEALGWGVVKALMRK